ncbi:MAG: hypothetical protein FWE29_04765 [Defluviitaleaceae bacterium]|nr:hypothetical protein [Defluviitaleaceae bacterium]
MEKNTVGKLPKNIVNLMSGIVKYVETADEKADHGVKAIKGASQNANQKGRV